MNSHLRADSDVPKAGQGTTYKRTTSKVFIRLDFRRLVSMIDWVTRLYLQDARERARCMNRIH